MNKHEKVRIESLCLKNEAAGKLPGNGFIRHDTITSGEGVTVYLVATPFGVFFEVVTPLQKFNVPMTDAAWFKADMDALEERAQKNAVARTRAEAEGLRPLARSKTETQKLRGPNPIHVPHPSTLTRRGD